MYPGILIKVASANVKQAQGIIEKIEQLKDTHPMIAAHILKINFRKDYGKVKFRGGSQIETVVCGEGARGGRAQILILDESRLMAKDDIENNLMPFLTGRRKPAFIGKKKEYEKELAKEHNSLIYLTSIGFKNEWSYKDFQTNVGYMANGMLNYFCMALPYQFGVEAGIITEDFIETQLRSSSEDIGTFRKEMEVVAYGTTEHSLFDYSKISKLRAIHQALYPITDREYILTKGNIYNSRYYVPKQPGEIRVLSFDIAYALGRKNDNSVISVFRLIEDNDRYIKTLSYMEALNGCSPDEQALKVKRIFYNLECNYAVVDPGGSGGIAMVQVLGQKTVDPIRGIRYPGWRTYNNDAKFDEYVKDVNADPVMYCMPSSNVNIHYQLKTLMDVELDRHTIMFLVDEKDIMDELNEQFEYLRLSTGNSYEREEAKMLIQSYANTSSMIFEAINAKMVQTRSGRYTIDEGTGRKDRIISVLYGVYFIVTYLEKDLESKNRKCNYAEYFNASTNQRQLKNPFSSNLNKLKGFGKRV